MHTSVFGEELAQKWDPMEPILDFVVSLMETVAGVESCYGRSRCGNIAPGASMLIFTGRACRRLPAPGRTKLSSMLLNLLMVLLLFLLLLLLFPLQIFVLMLVGLLSCGGHCSRCSRGTQIRRVGSARGRHSDAAATCDTCNTNQTICDTAHRSLTASPNPTNVFAFLEAVQPTIGPMKVFKIALSGCSACKPLNYLAINFVIPL